MKKVIVASENPVKVRVAERAFAAVFPHLDFEFVATKSDSKIGINYKSWLNNF